MEAAIEHFNKMLTEKKHPLKLHTDMNLYSLRIAKKKNGKPNSDYPRKHEIFKTAISIQFKLKCNFVY